MDAAARGGRRLSGRTVSVDDDHAGRFRGLRVADTTWPAVEARASGGAVGILPVGAASKAHGRHLPMNTDWLQVEWLAGQLLRRADVLVWPTLGYGHYPAFTDYPGSTSLSEATFIAIVAELLGSIRRAGVTRCLVLNAGVSTIAPLETAVRVMKGFAVLRIANLYSGAGFRAAEHAVRQQARGGHADEIETSIMLAIAPEVVDMSCAEACVARAIRGRFDRADPGSPNFSPDGVYGDPTLASVEKGARLCDAMLADTLSVLNAMNGHGP